MGESSRCLLDSQALIEPAIERRLHRNIESQVRKLDCTVLAVNGTLDHIHLLVSFPTTVTIAGLLKQIKGVSSHFVNEVLPSDVQFRWQRGYGAFTVSRWDLPRVIDYVKRQKEHHMVGGLQSELEETFESIEAMDG